MLKLIRHIPIHSHFCPHSHVPYSRFLLNFEGLLLLLPPALWQIFLQHTGSQSLFADPLMIKAIISMGFCCVLDITTGLLQHQKTFWEGNFFFFPMLAFLSVPSSLPLPTLLIALFLGHILTEWVFKQFSLVPFVCVVYICAYIIQPDAFLEGALPGASLPFLQKFPTAEPWRTWFVTLPEGTLNTFIIGYVIAALGLYLGHVIDFRAPVTSVLSYFTLLSFYSPHHVSTHFASILFALLIVTGDTRIEPANKWGKYLFGGLVGILTAMLGVKAEAGYFGILMACIFCTIIDKLLRPLLVRKIQKTYEVLQ